MTWNDQPVQPAQPSAPAPVPSGRAGLSPARRVATLLLALGLLAVGGGAVAFAADPSASPDPAATTQPSTGGANGSTTAPSTNGQAPADHARGDCPDKAGTGSGSGSGSGPDASAAPSTPSTDDPTAAPSAEL